MQQTNNIFARHLYDKDKNKFRLLQWFRYKRFLRLIDKSVPSFDILWQIADFIKILEQVFLYDNSPIKEMYSSDKYKPNENGFVVKKYNYTITIKLYEDDKSIAIQVDRGNKKASTSMKFREGDPLEDGNNEHVLKLIENIENIIMNSAKELFIKYYNMKN